MLPSDEQHSYYYRGQFQTIELRGSPTDTSYVCLYVALKKIK
jgi:hypothetical protein